jgi:hypothetical protein
LSSGLGCEGLLGWSITRSLYVGPPGTCEVWREGGSR